MTTELTWLLLTAILAGSLWIPYIIGVQTTEFEGKDQLLTRPPDQSRMKPWVQRSFRAHLNLLEQLSPFAVVVLVGAILKISTPVTVWCCVAFFWLRVLHAVVMISGLRIPLRPVIYVSGWVVILTIAWQNFVHAPPI